MKSDSGLNRGPAVARRYLGTLLDLSGYDVITFGANPDAKFDVWMENGELHIRSSFVPLAIYPEVSNVIRVKASQH